MTAHWHLKKHNERMQIGRKLSHVRGGVFNWVLEATKEQEFVPSVLFKETRMSCSSLLIQKSVEPPLKLKCLVAKANC